MSDQMNTMDFETFIKTNQVVPNQPIKEQQVKQEDNKISAPTSRGNVVIPTKIEIKQSLIHNQGVFAKEQISEGELIEIAPLLKLEWRMQYQHDPIIKSYIWPNLSCNCRDCKVHSPIAYMPMGYAPLYNHSETPNVSLKFNWAEQTVSFKAMKNIEIGEELFIHYLIKSWNQNDKK
jgi:SET domain-containing protein